MRLKPRTWLLISLLLFAASAWMWQLGERINAERQERALLKAGRSAVVAKTGVTGKGESKGENGGGHRPPLQKISNTAATLAQVLRNEHGIILRHALIDTAKPVKLDIPEHLRSHGAPGSYIVQSDRALNAEFYAALARHGAQFINYIPNNAALVQASPAAARAMVADAVFQAVLPYEPYFKLDDSLLTEAVDQTRMVNNQLRVTTFPGQRDAALKALQALGANLMGEDQTPFGPTLIVNVPPDQLAAVAQMPLVWDIEAFSTRRPLNDLTRVRLGVSTNTLMATPNYFNLTGQSIWMGLNDTGVDGKHLDFVGRLLGDTPITLTDADGHGTHVAGTMIGSGAESDTISNTPPGSVTNASFRGMATNASLYVQRVNMVSGPYVSDSYLQTNGSYVLRNNALTNGSIVTNGFIVNDSWSYQSTFYDLAAASYDQAARDAEPGVPGEQGVLYVFAAGDRGNQSPDAITSPGTLKNGITVGAMDSPRFITNTVNLSPLLTNYAIFESDTFDSNEVAGFSSSGNVDVGVEGAGGRFKPDVVAPGAFIISTRSSQYVDPTGNLVLFYLTAPGQNLPPGTTNFYSIDITTNTTNVFIQLSANDVSPEPFPANLAVYFDTAFPPVTPLSVNAAGVFAAANPPVGVYNLAIVNPLGQQPVNFDLKVYAITNGPYGTNWPTSYFGVLSNLNSTLFPNYRYESGTSMAAAAVSGLLGLVQEYLIKNFNFVPSPALLKALLINGSSALNNQSDFNPNSPVNAQGWGLPNLANILPGSLTNTSKNFSIWFTNQSAANALQTGQQQDYQVKWDTTTNTNLANFPLRVTLVWTDPPGNPAAGIALVNNLELVVTDSQSNVYVGNNFFQGDIFTEFNPGGTNLAPGDIVNNVQNVYIDATYGLLPPYTVSVRANRVNVNAVTTQTSAIEQDYALVISTDDPSPTNALVALPAANLVNNNAPLITVANDSVPLLHQRVGGNEANLYNFAAGATNGEVAQWHFFIFTNTFTNVVGTNILYGVFTTFLPPTLTFPNSTPPNLSVPAANDADIDLYVSTDPGMTNLNLAAVSQSSKSLGRGGDETVFWTNTFVGQVFYIGVKSETQQGSDFAFFAEITTNIGAGNGLQPVFAYGAPLPANIPDSFLGTVGAYVIAPMASTMTIRKVAAEVGVEHSNPVDLLGSLAFDGISDTVNHFSGAPGGFTNWYDDLPDGSIPGAQPSDGPGSLRNFIGQRAGGSWILTESDAAQTQVGEVWVMTVEAWPQPPNPFLFTTTIPPFGWYFGYVDLPNDVTNLNIAVGAYNPAGGGPAGIYITNQDFVNLNDYGVNPIPSPGGALDIPNTNLDIPLASAVNGPPPALTGGRWFYGITNESAAPLTVTVSITIQESLTPNLNVLEANNTITPLLTDAHTTSQICVGSGLLTNNQQLVSLQLGLRIDDTNLDDLVITLTSPQGTSVELFENRGGTQATQLGLTDTNGNYVYTTFTEDTNLASTLIKFVPPPFAQPISTVTLINSSFEPAELGQTNGDYGITNGFFATLGTNLEGWLVTNGDAAVVSNNDLYTTPAGTNYLALAAGTLTRTIPTVIGQSYALTNLYRGPGLIDWYPFEGDANDIIGTNNGTINGSITNVYGVVGQGLMLNGNNTSTQINFGTNAGNFGTNDFTIDYWMWTTAAHASGPMTFLSKRAVCGAGDLLEIQVGGGALNNAGFLNLQLDDNANNYTPFSSTLQINDGLWHHVAWERRSSSPTNSTLSVYVDGKLNNTAHFQAVANLNNPSPLLMGYSPCEASPDTTGTTNYAGAADELDIWNRALSDVEIAAIYSAGTNHVGKATTNSIFPNIQYQVNGTTLTNLIAPASSTNWLTNTLYFTAVSNTTTVTIQGNPLGMLLDDFILTGPTNANYVLPEESLATLNGQNPNGCWTLDVWDTRADSTAPTNGTLLSWNMQMTISSTNVNLVVLTNGVGYTTPTNLGVPGNSIAYFAFDAPANANFVTNILTNCSSPLNLLFNQAALPTGAQPGDYPLLLNITTNGIAVLTNNTPAPSFVRGARYFLAVQNNNATAATFTLEAQTDQLTTSASVYALSRGVIYTNNILATSNAVPYTTNLFATNAPEYYSFFVPTNAVLASFTIVGSSNPADQISLYAANGLPLPSSASYDFATSFDGTGSEAIVVTTNDSPVVNPFATANSAPVPLTSGKWYLAVYDYSQSTNTNTYFIVANYATFSDINVISLTDGVPTNGLAAPGPALTNFYSFKVLNSPSNVQFTVSNMVGGNVDLIVRDGALPTPQQMTLGSFNSGLTPEVITIVSNTLLTSLNGTWYLGVPNETLGTVGYTIIATTTNVPGTYNYPAVVFAGLAAPSPTKGFTMNWQSVPGAGYEVDMTTTLSTWMNATNFTATNSTTTFTDPTPIASHAARFYRVFRTH